MPGGGEGRATRIWLLRHGAVEAPEGVYYGQMDVPLSDLGRRQSEAAAEGLRGVALDGIFSSDLGRCRYLAELLAKDRPGVPLHLTSDLRELEFGEWSGWHWNDIERRAPHLLARRMADLAAFRPPGGESLGDLLARAWRVVEGIVRGDAGGTFALVGHGGTNRVVLARALGLPLDRVFCLGQDLACLNCLDLFPDGNAVVRLLNGRVPWDAGAREPL
ncbi:histidine phosphatase family protein [Dissulfurirhabdus thermomarina]|uniref:Histidine phosphatase family protein n=1 Tax=Dissulfurirhabdus thermomarina TaxID=1765737 RepID=A0A6N9TNP4_DISTH|nr:histidine phosphatase family protein [Dissulfurirhabdus thermomarina]NDY41713.1 histidine phosphatase family protein [Dissulfurirhabdus thermomarina]NMX23199.1 histidine phosphatase family protein [Dissulfurirhabdus thermomarina]